MYIKRYFCLSLYVSSFSRWGESSSAWTGVRVSPTAPAPWLPNPLGKHWLCLHRAGQGLSMGGEGVGLSSASSKTALFLV